MTLSQIKDILKTKEAELLGLHVKSLFVFGSVARGEEKKTSDIDFLVEFSQPVGMFDFLGLMYFLEDLLKTKIDLATKKALHPRLRDDILKEAIRVA
ncbi:MAG: nucleotidyltransferase family protein [Oligoflexia bacterium]|nr:nucleotidyltransferase family protein [Oligoflexia bacterium]